MNPLSPGHRAEVACVIEATARKPGNVHRVCDFADTHYVDFLLAAAAIRGPLDRARETGVGAAILGAVEQTRRVAAGNPNLGIILLLAPLAAVPDGEPLRIGLDRVLNDLSIQDADLAYRAIRLAHPGGLGEAEDQDVHAAPTVTLLEAMRLAADRDAVARQYATGYADVLDVAVPTLDEALKAGRTPEQATILAHLTLMGRFPDTLIARKRGAEVADESARLARLVLKTGWPDGPGSSARLDELDCWLRADGHARNPGATADLVAAALFVALGDGTIPLPLPRFD